MTLLDIVLFLPLVAFIVILALPRTLSRTLALATSTGIFIVSLGLLAPFLGKPTSAVSFETNLIWIQSPAIRYHISLDGLGLWLLLLSTMLTPLCVLISWNYITDRVKEYYAFLLLLEFVVIGVFVSMDLFLFYVFWEVTLVPMYVLIGIW